MKVLHHIVSRKVFCDIANGTMTQITIDVRPANNRRFVQLDDLGFRKEDAEGNVIPVVYDAVHFSVGVGNKLGSMLVAVKCQYADMTEIEYTEKGQMWYQEQIVFVLGQILECETKP